MSSFRYKNFQIGLVTLSPQLIMHIALNVDERQMQKLRKFTSKVDDHLFLHKKN